MSATTNKRPRNPLRGFSQPPKPFLLCVVMATARSGAVGSEPDRAGVMIPLWLQGALWHKLTPTPLVTGSAVIGRDSKGISFTNSQEAEGLSAHPGSEMDHSRNHGTAGWYSSSKHAPWG